MKSINFSVSISKISFNLHSDCIIIYYSDNSNFCISNSQDRIYYMMSVIINSFIYIIYIIKLSIHESIKQFMKKHLIFFKNKYF